MTASVVSTIAKNPLLLRNLWRLFCVNRTESEFRKSRMVRTEKPPSRLYPFSASKDDDCLVLTFRRLD